MPFDFRLAGVAALQVLMALLLQIVVIRGVGNQALTDSWVAAQTLPAVLFAIFSVAFQGTWQTALANVLGDVGRSTALQRCAHGQLILALGTLFLLAIGTADLWVGWMFPGFSPSQLEVTAYATRVLLLGAVMNTHCTLYLTALRGQDRFLSGELVILAGSVVGLFTTVAVLPSHGIEGATWASTLRWAGTMLVLFRLSGSPIPSLHDAIRLGGQWRQLWLLTWSSALYKFTPLVDRYFGSLAATGGLTLFNLAQTAIQAGSLVIDRGLITPSVPSIARLGHAGNWAGLRQLYRRKMVLALLPTMAALLLLLLLYPVWLPLLDSLLRIKAAGHESWLVSLLLIGFLYPASCGSIVYGAFYAMGKPELPARIGVAGFALSIALKALMFRGFGLPGLALAISMHNLGNLLVMHLVLSHRLDQLEQSSPPRAMT